MELKTLEVKINKILEEKKQEAGKRMDEWRKRNKKYFRNWDSVKAIRFLRERYGRS